MGWAQRITPPRRGTELIDLGDEFQKISENFSKIEAEFHYFESLPKELRRFHPEVRRLENDPENSYRIRKIPTVDASIVLTSSELFRLDFFKELFAKLTEYFSIAPTVSISRFEYMELLEFYIFEKDRQRLLLLEALPTFPELQKILESSGFLSAEALQISLHQLIIHHATSLSEFKLYYAHGDLCLSNLLLHEHELYLIDPRGLSADRSPMNPLYYDYAKLSQCFEGAYDFINHSLSDGTLPSSASSEFQTFCRTQGVHRPLMKALEGSLFLSMIPLHDDNPIKMAAFLRQAIKIAHELNS